MDVIADEPLLLSITDNYKKLNLQRLQGEKLSNCLNLIIKQQVNIMYI